MDFVVAVVATLLAMRHAFLQLVMLSPPHRERHIREAPPGMRATGSMHVWRFSCEVRRQAHGRVVSTSTRNARRESHFERESHQMKCANMRCTISRGECCLMSLDPLSNLPPHCTLTLAPAPPHAPRSSFLLQTRARHGTVSCCWMRRLFILISSLHS